MFDYEFELSKTQASNEVDYSLYQKIAENPSTGRIWKLSNIFMFYSPIPLFFFQCLPSQDPTVTNTRRKSPLQNQNGTLTLSLARHSMKPTSKSMCQGEPRSQEIHPCPRSAAPQQTPRKRSLCTLRWWVTFLETSGRRRMTRVRLCTRRWNTPFSTT